MLRIDVVRFLYIHEKHQNARGVDLSSDFDPTERTVRLGLAASGSNLPDSRTHLELKAEKVLEKRRLYDNFVLPRFDAIRTSPVQLERSSLNSVDTELHANSPISNLEEIEDNQTQDNMGRSKHRQQQPFTGHVPPAQPSDHALVRKHKKRKRSTVLDATIHKDTSTPSSSIPRTAKKPKTERSIQEDGEADVVDQEPGEAPDLDLSSPLHVVLARTHTLKTSSVISSSKMTAKVRMILSAWASGPEADEGLDTSMTTELAPASAEEQAEKMKKNKTPSPSPLLILRARDSAATKLISIVEIAKRELTRRGTPWFQYTTVESIPTAWRDPNTTSTAKQQELEPDGTAAATPVNPPDMDVDVDDDDDEKTFFETMPTPSQRALLLLEAVAADRPPASRVRAVPLLRVYLAPHRVDVLRKRFGEASSSDRTG